MIEPTVKNKKTAVLLSFSGKQNKADWVFERLTGKKIFVFNPK